jgi:hypothetical protein
MQPAPVSRAGTLALSFPHWLFGPAFIGLEAMR